jgi:hypothetical protein
MAGALKAWGGLDEEAEAKLEIREARRNLFFVNKELSEYAAQIAEAQADVDTREARTKLDLLEHALLSIDRSRVTAQTDVQIARSLAKIQLLRREMSALAHQGDGIDTARIVKEFARLATVANRARSSMTTGAAGPGPFESLSRNLKLARVNLGPFVIGLQGLGRLWLLMIPKVAALAAGILALASSLGAAVLGLGALAVATAGVIGPMAILGIAAGTIFAGAKTGLDDYRTAMEALRQATRAQEDAERNLSQAQRDADDAQKNLTAERREARSTIEDNIASTGAALADAENALTVAQENQLTAQRALTDARIAATRALLDMKFAAEGAALGEKRAEINLKKARNALRALGDDAPRMKLKEARLAVQEAELALKQAREEGTRSQEDLTTAEDRGIDGSDQMISARQGVEQANYAVVTATRDLTAAIEDSNAAQKATVANSENVLSARKRLHQVNRSIIDQERALKFATQDVNKAQRQLNRAQRDAAPLMTKAGKAIRKALNDTKRAFIANLGPGVERIWQGLANGLEEDFIPLLESLRSDFRSLGSTVGKAIQQLFARMNSDDARLFFSEMIQGAAKVVPLLTKGFFKIAHIFANIAEAALPHLINGLKAVNGFLKDLSGKSDNPLLGLAIGGAVSQLGDWLKLIGSIVRALFSLGNVAADDGQTLIQWITEMVNKFADWASSTEGQNQIQEFLDEMIPLFMGLLDLVGELIKFGIRIAEIFGPIALVINKVLTTILDLINDILGPLTELPDVIKIAIGAFLLFKGPIGILRSLVGVIGGLITRLGIGGLAGSIGGLASRALPALGLALRAVPFVGAALAVAEYGDDVGKAVASFAGYSDEIIQAQEDLGHAQDTLSNRLFSISQVIRNLRAAGAKQVHTKQDLFNMFSPDQLNRAIAIAERGGDLMGKGFVQKALDRLHAGREKFRMWFTGLGSSFISWIQQLSPALKKAGEGIIAGIAQGIKGFSPVLGNALEFGIKKLKDLLPGSEPKDPSSPLRGLEKAGQAIVGNIAKGIMSAQEDLPNKLALRVHHAMGNAGAGKSGGGQTINHNSFDLRATGVKGGGYPNADEYMAAVSRNLRKRGLSLA